MNLLIVLLNCFCSVWYRSNAQEKPVGTAGMFHLPSSLHTSRELTSARIRVGTGVLDSNDRPFIALKTIQGRLADSPGPPQQSEAQITPPISDLPILVSTDAMSPDTAG